MTAIKKVILADDESASRNLLKEYLQEYPYFQVVAECKNGIEAAGCINALQPDLIFLDIQMPGKTGFEVLQEIEYIPQVIFSTAYDQYALKAFEVNAVDYLLKPYTRERFRHAVDRLFSHTQTTLHNIQQLAESLQTKTYPDKLLVEQGTKLVSLSVNDILWLEAEGDYTRIHTRKQFYISSKGISELESRLNPRQFQRVHRSAMVSIAAIKEVHREASGPQIVLENDVVIKVSRSYTEAIRKLMI